MGGIDQSVFVYVDESIKQCKELASFVKKKQQADVEHAKALLKLTLGFARHSVAKSPMAALSMALPMQTAPQSDKAEAAAMLRRANVWRVFRSMVADAEATATAQLQKSKYITNDILLPFIAHIKEMENVRKEHVENVQEYTKNVEEALTTFKKAKKELEQLQFQTAEFSANFSKAQALSSTKDRELEKLSQRVNTSVEKTLKAQETFKLYKSLCQEAQSDYFGILLPRLCEVILIKEEERSVAALRVITDCLYVENMHQTAMRDATTAILGDAAAVNISVDSKELVDKLIRKEVMHRHQIHATQHTDSILSAKIKVKRGNTVSDWTSQHVVFTFDKHLDFYDTHQLDRPHSSVNLHESSAIEIHASLFSQPWCLQIVHYTLLIGQELITLAFETEAEKDTWQALLNLYTYCCPQCALAHGYNTETECNQILSEKENGCRIVKSLEIGVIEAKELVFEEYAGVEQKGPLNAFCGVQLGGLKMAKSRAKEGDCPFWGEDEIRPHVETIRITIHHENRLRRPMQIGHVDIPLKTIKQSTGGKKVEEWYPIEPSPGSPPQASTGSIRLCLKYQIDQILPRNEYTSFLTLLTDPHFKALNVLGGITPSSMRHAFAKTVVRLLVAKGVEVEGVTSLIETDIANTSDANIIFRGNTLGTKAMDVLMSLEGVEYLRETIGKLVREINESEESCEVDPARVGTGEELKENTERLLGYVVGVWGAIVESAGRCPKAFVDIFTAIKDSIRVKWSSDETVKVSAIGGFIFLRFFCPALLSPYLFKLVDDIPDTNRSRTFTLVAKIIQSLANLTIFGQKEQYLQGFNAFIKAEIPNMKQFIDNISIAKTSPPSPIPQPPLLRIDLRRETEEFYQLCLTLTKDLTLLRDQHATKKSPEVYIAERLLSELRKLDASHEARGASRCVSGVWGGRGVKEMGGDGVLGKLVPPPALPRQSMARMSRSGSSGGAQVSTQAVKFGDDFVAEGGGRGGEGSLSSPVEYTEIQSVVRSGPPSLLSQTSGAVDGVGVETDASNVHRSQSQTSSNTSGSSVEVDMTMLSVGGSSGGESVVKRRRSTGRSAGGSSKSSSVWSTNNVASAVNIANNLHEMSERNPSIQLSLDRGGSSLAISNPVHPVRSLFGLFAGLRKNTNSASAEVVATSGVDDPEENLAYIQAKGFGSFQRADSQDWDAKSADSMDEGMDKRLPVGGGEPSRGGGGAPFPLAFGKKGGILGKTAPHRFSLDFLGRSGGERSVHGSQDLSSLNGASQKAKQGLGLKKESDPASME
ncbi:hypothetical protein HDU98_011860 [Podochytrium sp. JEL0797]|nr:hypothetical protein HDU98_011860 [Podochytrium sp. JEL0797]